MSGLAGIARTSGRPIEEHTLWRMAAAIRHRGPDASNVFVSERVGLAHTRLSIIDSAGGVQPMSNPDGTLVVACAGAVYNYRELRAELEAAGHRFLTSSDTEVLIHAYEQWGEAMLPRLNGQFAFALFDRRHDIVFLARDRFGVRPLFVAIANGDLVFASEAKAMFASREVTPAPDLRGLDEAFSLWAARAPRTVFKGVRQIEPGTSATWRGGRLRVNHYYEPRFPEATVEADGAIETLDGLMQSAVALRMRADVPVGGFLSGGLDSSIACSLATCETAQRLRTFSAAFEHPSLDESPVQRAVAKTLDTEHHVVHIRASEIADVFPAVVVHAETPLLRTAPAPIYLLARATREAGITAVLSGEGSDELFLGYDIFKETLIRRFCLRQPASKLRPRLFERLYPYLPRTAAAAEFWRNFMLSAGAPSDPVFSHMPRFRIAARIKDFYSSDMRASLAGSDPIAELRQSMPDDFADWSPANRAAYLELTTLMPSYLLSSQGDRMTMAHGVEGRYPFLDHRVFEFAASLPVSSKLRGLHDKDILRRWAAAFLPTDVTRRSRQPYHAADAASFFGTSSPAYVRELLSPDAIRANGIFDAVAVAGLVRRCADGLATGFAENQALIAVLSTQLWYEHFIKRPELGGRPIADASIPRAAIV
jgi:asparagine synthase (glutamine-hydrolysing)